MPCCRHTKFSTLRYILLSVQKAGILNPLRIPQPTSGRLRAVPIRVPQGWASCKSFIIFEFYFYVNICVSMQSFSPVVIKSIGGQIPKWKEPTSSWFFDPSKTRFRGRIWLQIGLIPIILYGNCTFSYFEIKLKRSWVLHLLSRIPLWIYRLNERVVYHLLLSFLNLLWLSIESTYYPLWPWTNACKLIFAWRNTICIKTTDVEYGLTRKNKVDELITNWSKV